VQRHFGSDARKRLHQEVRRTHAGLDRAEGMLDRFAPRAHGSQVLVEPLLHGLDDMLVLPPRDPTLHSGRALAPEGAAPAGGPVTATRGKSLSVLASSLKAVRHYSG
jgi:hypothetical protein